MAPVYFPHLQLAVVLLTTLRNTFDGFVYRVKRRHDNHVDGWMDGLQAQGVPFPILTWVSAFLVPNFVCRRLCALLAHEEAIDASVISAHWAQAWVESHRIRFTQARWHRRRLLMPWLSSRRPCKHETSFGEIKRAATQSAWSTRNQSINWLPIDLFAALRLVIQLISKWGNQSVAKPYK